MEISEVQDSLRQFAAERDWEQFHSPRNLMLALTGELGELAAEMQWATDHDLLPASRSPEKQTRLQEELADVGIYLLRLADVLQIDLAEAMMDKIAANAQKYPPDLAKGSAAKYTDLRGE